MANSTMGAKARRGLTVSAAALTASLIGTSGAWAQCTDNFNYNLSGNIPASAAFPLGGGSGISALTATINTTNTAFLTSTSAFVSAPGNPRPNQQGGGAWGRVIAGTVDTETASTSRLTEAPGRVPAATGQQNCNTTTSQDYWGYQVGHDISILNGGATGANWHWGITAGHLEARTRDTTRAGQFTKGGLVFNTPAGSFSNTSEVPFAGVYTAFTVGNLALDAQARWDFYQNRLSDPLNGLFEQRLDAQGISLTGNASYNIPLGNGWFIEPSGGFVWSRVSVDTLAVPGVPTVLPGGTVPLAAGTLSIADVESVLGRASFRVGTNFQSGGMVWQPFFTASLFHEFAGDVTARAVESNFGGFVLTSTAEGGLHTYGQFALGTAAVLVNTGWLGYARVDYRVGEDIEGWSVNAGLRYQFTPGQQASVKDGPGPVDTYNWTGPYIGAFVGTTWGEEGWRFIPTNNSVVPDYAGYIGGGQVGYNLQLGSVVVGVEGDFGLSNAHGGVSCPNAQNFNCTADVDNLASVAGRVGFTWGRALFYGKAGWAGADVTAGTRHNETARITGEDTRWRNGWTAGLGMEFALTNRWSAKAEWMHYDLGEETHRVQSINPITLAPVNLNADVETHGNIVRIGVNLHLHPREEARPLK